MTYSNGELFVGQSLFFHIDACTGYSSPVDERNFIELPSNITELNGYMCGSANRKGSLCSVCIDSFGPLATSSEIMCSNCITTFARYYSVLVYLLSELIPVSTLFLSLKPT